MSTPETQKALALARQMRLLPFKHGQDVATTIEALAKRVQELEAQAAELLADRAIVDWLEIYKGGVWFNDRVSDFVVQANSQVVGCVARERTFRAACLAAMKGTK